MGGAAAAAGQAGQETRPSWTIGTYIIDMCVNDTCSIDTRTYIMDACTMDTCIIDACIMDTSAWVTRHERPKGAKDEVKDAQRAKSRPEGLPTRSRGPTGP